MAKSREETVMEGKEKIWEIAKQLGLCVPIVWSKENLEDGYEIEISDDDWSDRIRSLEKNGDFSETEDFMSGLM
ncbi:MAG: hypothetical protein B6229_00475 [Spirochaetaceae bacterium 4572_7]|nr:MAG: hypothetical protein B6229_00475 [Spirochaetaceae bacterium 4572_7]